MRVMTRLYEELESPKAQAQAFRLSSCLHLCVQFKFVGLKILSWFIRFILPSGLNCHEVYRFFSLS